MAKPKRGRTFPVSGWWLALVREQLKRETVEEGGKGLPALAARLSGHVERKPPWDHAPLNHLKNGKGAVTTDLAEALCIEFDLPSPVVYPRSLFEAQLMEAVAQAFDEGKTPSIEPDEVRRRARDLIEHGIRRKRRHG